MRFLLIDRIVEFEKRARLKGIKNLSLAEEYLKDHFPLHPVMPGVLMLETLVQAGAWLCRLSNDFKYSIILLAEARTIRYGKFVAPGQQLAVEVNWLKEAGESVELSAKGFVGEETVVSAKLKLKQSNLSDVKPSLAFQDESLIRFYKTLLPQVYSEDLARV